MPRHSLVEVHGIGKVKNWATHHGGMISAGSGDSGPNSIAPVARASAKTKSTASAVATKTRSGDILESLFLLERGGSNVGMAGLLHRGVVLPSNLHATSRRPVQEDGLSARFRLQSLTNQ
jgi:hypothetical protein